MPVSLGPSVQIPMMAPAENENANIKAKKHIIGNFRLDSAIAEPKLIPSKNWWNVNAAIKTLIVAILSLPNPPKLTPMITEWMAIDTSRTNVFTNARCAFLSVIKSMLWVWVWSCACDCDSSWPTTSSSCFSGNSDNSLNDVDFLWKLLWLWGWLLLLLLEEIFSSLCANDEDEDDDV